MCGVRVWLLMPFFVGAVVFGGRGADPAPAQSSGGNPLAGVRFFVDADSPAWEQWRAYQRSGQQGKADLVWKIAREPRALWLGRFTRPNFHVKVRRLIDAAAADGSVPIFTVLRAQSTGCSSRYDGGGSAEDARTRAWYDDLARAIGDDRVVIAFEPDSLGTIDCHAPSRRDDRIRLLRYGVNALSALPNATIYLEAGASDWEPARRTAKQLRAIGIAKVRGFMLNATHYDWTRNNIRHGLEISRRVGGKHFIINTAENGRGPIHYYLRNGRRITVWCNPPLRGLGTPPTTNTSDPMVDAYLWINRPGYAQSCQHRPIAWYPPRALSYARYATTWESAPKGTRFGHKKRFSLSSLGVRR
jgi:endoglucanase